MQSSSVSPRERIVEWDRSRLCSGVETLAQRDHRFHLSSPFANFLADSFNREANDVSIMRAARGRVRMNRHRNGALVNGETVNEPRMFARSSSL